MKLTKAQMQLLGDLREAGGSTVVHTGYPPAKALVRAGLCRWETIGLSDILVLTAAGIAFFAEEKLA